MTPGPTLYSGPVPYGKSAPAGAAQSASAIRHASTDRHLRASLPCGDPLNLSPLRCRPTAALRACQHPTLMNGRFLTLGERLVNRTLRAQRRPVEGQLAGRERRAQLGRQVGDLEPARRSCPAWRAPASRAARTGASRARTGRAACEALARARPASSSSAPSRSARPSANRRGRARGTGCTSSACSSTGAKRLRRTPAPRCARRRARTGSRGTRASRAATPGARRAGPGWSPNAVARPLRQRPSTTGGRQVERHEQAHARAAEPLLGHRLERRGLAAQQPPQQVQRDGGRAVADVAARAGQVERARDALLVAVEHRGDAEAHAADRLVRRAAPGSRDAGQADRRVGVEALERAVGERLRDLVRDRAVLLDQLAPARPAARSWPRSSTRPRRRRSTPRRRGGRSGARPAGRRCTTPPPPAGGPAAAPRPARRSSCRPSRRPSRRGARPSSPRARSAAASLASSERITISSSRAAQAGRDLEPVEAHLRVRDAQRLGDLGLGDAEHAHHRLAVARRAGDGLLERLGLHRLAPALLQLARRARAAPRRPGRSPARPAPARCRPGRARPRPRAPSPACGWRTRAPCGSRFQRRAKRAMISPIRRSSASSSCSGRPAKSATISAVMSSAVGPRPPLVRIRSAPSARMNSSAASRSSRRSPVISTCASSTPSSARRSASHGPLRSRTRPERTSVPGHDDSGADAQDDHPHVGRRSPDSDARPGAAHQVADRLRALGRVAPAAVDPQVAAAVAERHPEGAGAERALTVARRARSRLRPAPCPERPPRIPTRYGPGRPRGARCAGAAAAPASAAAGWSRSRSRCGVVCVAGRSLAALPSSPSSSPPVRPSTNRNATIARTAMPAPIPRRGGPTRRARSATRRRRRERRDLELLGLLEARAVLVDQQVRVEPQELRVGAQEGLDVGRPRQHDPLLVLQRPQVLGADLRRLLDRRDVDLVADARFAQQ